MVLALYMSAATVAANAEISTLDRTSHGYGQGLEVDENNRPTGAALFNDQYGCYDCYAMLDSDKEIYLTFDQGYENGYTAPILDTLKEKNAKAVFFLTGDYAERNEELVKRMIDEGHIIGNHGMKHASLPKLSPDEAKKEIMTLHDLVKEKYGYEMTYFRPPCGEYSEQSMAVCQSLGYKTLLWSFAYADWDVNNQPEKTAAFERVSGAAHGGGIYLLHSVSATNAEILPQVIDSFREQGFEIALPKI
ncbi:MAG: polysaccharide deacetylase family protein [Oscillospiraceae bacterium]|nr:polysaccharide deacetylase family protein [Oscillospiraceae bacterium]